MITKLRYLILNQELPQYKLAALIGIHPSTLSIYALGRQPIQNAHLPLLTRYFNIPPEEILGYYDMPDIIPWAEDLEKEEQSHGAV